MGVLTAVFVASESEVVSTDFATLFPGDLFPVLEAKGLTDLELEMLNLILDDKDPAVLNEDMEASWYERSAWDHYIGMKMDNAAEDDGPWVQRFPETLETGLSMLTASEAAEVGRKWATVLWAELQQIETQYQASSEFSQKTGNLYRLLGFILSPLLGRNEPNDTREQDFVNGVLTYIERLRQLSRIARDEGKHLYLWTSL